MDKISILYAKFAGLLKNLNKLEYGRTHRISGFSVEPLFQQFEKCRKELIELLPELYSDLPMFEMPKSLGTNSVGENLYSYYQIKNIIQSINYILEVRANYRIGEKNETEERPKRIFLSHGRSKEWYKVQAFVEKDFGLKTLELAQEANLGRTVLQKLNEEASRCSYAIIVMTGDDIFEKEVRARENVLHEIGFFQGKYGLQNVILLHEEGVNIPSNIHGIVYIPFPKDTVETTFGTLMRELKAVFN